ncbi:MAG: hypothetical protein HPY55_09945 [Firmicutes bacterium]|nr:hypothetical protein [Bacillota bacterium]
MPYTRAGLGRRVLASLVDAVISLVLAMAPVVGGLAAAAYMLAKDGLMDGRSPGKKIFNLKVVTVSGWQAATYVDSVKRNAIFAAPDLLMLVPIIGLTFAAPVSLAIFILELVFIITDPEGLRLGDKFAGTKVVEVLPERMKAA